jgi:aspartyl-tRNA(Asn)/glutamyl-tRNA(Gln) amidotransferase subunit B
MAHAEAEPVMKASPYEIVIGLEVHVQLATRTKLFCGCSTEFGAPPNTQTCPVCIGLPGSLPVMNREAYRLALRTAVALNCEIPPRTKWDRKQYYYPDLPKGYQISQYDLPMSRDGWLEISDPKGAFAPKRVGIIRAHLEEDAGKSMHDEAAGKADSRIDLNRAGTPLLEIVSQPDLRSPLEAKAYLTELKLLLLYLGVSDCNMEQGSLRVDANINLHIDTPSGKVATPIVEVKNMNSFRAVERAMAFEAERQYDVWQETKRKLGDVPKQTRGWDDQASVTRGQRSKEESSDYRYFPDPDLAPVAASPEEAAEVRAALGELPAALRARLEATYGIDPYDSDVIVNQGRAFADYFLRLAAESGDGKRASNWMQQDVLRTLKERGIGIEAFPVPVERLAELLRAVAAGEVDTSRGREVFSLMLDSGKPAAEVMRQLGIEKVDASAVVELCRGLLAANPNIVAEVKAGKTKGIGSLIGQAKKENPNVDPNLVRQTFQELIARM